MSQQNIEQKTRIVINGHSLSFAHPKELLTYLLLEVLDLKYSPIDVLLEGLRSAFYISGQLAKETKQSARGVSLSQRQLFYWKLIKSRSEFCHRVYDLVLSFEGKGNLPGFGISNRYGDRIGGNPERIAYK